MNTEIIALYFGAGAVFITMAIALFKYMKSLVDKDCPLDNCPHCGCETYKGECFGRCNSDSSLKIHHLTPDIRPDMNEWLAQYNHPLVKYYGQL